MSRNNKKKYKFKKVVRMTTKFGKKLISTLSKSISVFFRDTIALILKIISVAIGLAFSALVVVPLLERCGVFENLLILEPLIDIIKELLEKLL